MDELPWLARLWIFSHIIAKGGNTIQDSTGRRQIALHLDLFPSRRHLSFSYFASFWFVSSCHDKIVIKSSEKLGQGSMWQNCYFEKLKEHMGPEGDNVWRKFLSSYLHSSFHTSFPSLIPAPAPHPTPTQRLLYQEFGVTLY